jgi:hypothetical protein
MRYPGVMVEATFSVVEKKMICEPVGIWGTLFYGEWVSHICI